MKKVASAFAALLIFPCMVFTVDIKGDFSTETRFSISNGDYLFNEENGRIKFDQQVDENLYGMAAIRFRYYDNPIGRDSLNGTLDLNELGILYSVQPFEISLDEAYFTYQNFIFERLDLTAGKERIAWGTADKLNPTDILDPNDFSDPFDFGRKIPVLAVNTVYHFTVLESSLQFVFEPYSSVARLNTLMQQSLENQLYSGIVSNSRNGVTSFNDSSSGWSGENVDTPAPSLSNSTAGLKLAGTLLGADVSVNYVSRINDIPTVRNVNVGLRTDLYGLGTVTNVTMENRSYSLAYYREEEAGFDFSRDMGFMLLWGEMAVTFPEEQRTYTAVQSDNYFMGNYVGSTNYTMEAVTVSNSAYVKYTIGVDKNIEGGWYVNVQYNHGFFNERGNEGPERLQDYFLIRIEKKFLEDKLKFAVTGFADINNLPDLFGSKDFNSYLTNNSGILGLFSISYSPSSGMTAEIGVYGITGADNSSLGLLKDYSMVYMKFDYSF